MDTALTIAGSDCSGGGGVQADLKAFTVLGVYGMSVVTAVEARNTHGLTAMKMLGVELVAAQLDAVVRDLPVGAFKTGMLGTVDMIDAVAEEIRRHGLDNYVCDPVIYGKAGEHLLDASAIHAYRKALLPLATVVTPNRPEAALLANMEPEELNSVAAARKAAEKIVRGGGRCVVVKGINTGDTITDVFYDGREFVEFPAKRITSKHTYGSGSMFSAVITAMLAQRIELLTAIDHARSCISQAIANHVKLGGGVRAVNALALTPQ